MPWKFVVMLIGSILVGRLLNHLNKRSPAWRRLSKMLMILCAAGFAAYTAGSNSLTAWILGLTAILVLIFLTLHIRSDERVRHESTEWGSDIYNME
jgi:hypothetical protein